MVERDSPIIWDCDGVLVDSEALSSLSFVHILKRYGVDKTVEEVFEMVHGGSIAAALEIMARLTGVADLEDLEKEYRRISSDLFETSLQPVPFVEVALTGSSSRRCVASNGPLYKIRRNLILTHLDTYFQEDLVFSAHEVGFFKPDPQLFLFAAAALGAAPESCTVIEDSTTGVKAAMSAGMKCFAYCPENKYELFESLGAFPFHDMRELPKLLALERRQHDGALV